jgi:hypothetical protein
MVYYDSCGVYVLSKKTLAEKIQAIETIILALEASALTSAGNEGISEYQLNDGQTIIKQVYQGSGGVAKAINDFEAIKQRYINQLQGRVYRLVDSKNFRNNGYN